MTKKVLFLYVLILSLQLVSSCYWPDCDCNNEDYEYFVSGNEIYLYDISGFYNTELTNETDSIARQALGLVLNTQFDFQVLQTAQSSLFNLNFGFTAAFACDCVPDTYQTFDPITALKLEVIDTENDSTSDLSFLIPINLNQVLTNAENYEYYPDELWNINIDLPDSISLPQSAKFKYTTILNSGESFSNVSFPIKLY